MLFSRSALNADAEAAAGQLITRWQYDEPTGQGVVHRAQDVEPYLEANKYLYNDGDGYSPSREFRRVASIPNVIVEQWMREGVNIFDRNHWTEIKRRLNDPENLYLRTAPGRV